MDISSFNFLNTCRLCLTENKRQFSLSDQEKDNQTYYFKINLAIGLKIVDHENLSQKICLNCALFIRGWLDFKEMCSQSDAFLRKTLKQNVTKDDEQKLKTAVDKFQGVFDKLTQLQQCSIKLEPENKLTLETSKASNNSSLDITIEDADGKNYFPKDCSDDENLALSVHRERLKGTKTEDCVADSETCSWSDASEKDSMDNSHKKRRKTRLPVPSSCKICEKTYKNSEILRQHMKSVHVSGAIECSQCQMQFKSLRSLKYHIHRHHGNLEAVPCSYCGKEFLDKKYLRIHENIHSQNAQYVCQFCGRRFIMKNNLTVHIKRHHMQKSNDFMCQVCGKAFPFKLYLKKHIKTHTDVKPHQCSHCSAKFRENTHLQKHINSIHLKLRPYLCQYCRKTFTRNIYLREHMEKQHLGLRKLECSQCGQSFQNKNSMKQHNCHAVTTTSIAT